MFKLRKTKKHIQEYLVQFYVSTTAGRHFTFSSPIPAKPKYSYFTPKDGKVTSKDGDKYLEAISFEDIEEPFDYVDVSNKKDFLQFLKGLIIEQGGEQFYSINSTLINIRHVDVIEMGNITKGDQIEVEAYEVYFDETEEPEEDKTVYL